MVDQHIGRAVAFAKILRGIDERLDLVWGKEGAEEPIIPGRWHVRRRNPPPHVDSYIPITTPDGGFRPPADDVLAMLDQRDMWKHGLPEPEKLRDESLLREQMKDEMASDFAAAKRVAGDDVYKRRWGRG